MNRIQNMFSGEGRLEEGVREWWQPGHLILYQVPLAASPSCTDFTDLRDEGLVAANLQRFTSGNLRRTSQDGGVRKASLETSYVDK